MSKKLWSPTETDSRDLVSTFLNVRSENTAQHSAWFRTREHSEQTSKEPNKNLQKICSQFVTTLWPKKNGRRAATNVRNRQEGSSENTHHVQHVDAEKNNKGVRKSRPDKKDKIQCTDGGGSELVEQSVRKRPLELQQGSGDDEQSGYEKRAKRKRFELEKVSPLQDSQQ